MSQEQGAGNAKSGDDHGDSSRQWNELRRARNRINSQRTRERERFQIESLEAQRTRLWLSNDAIRYQNNHIRSAIRKIRELKSGKAGWQPGTRTTHASASAPTAHTRAPSISPLRSAQHTGISPVGQRLDSTTPAVPPSSIPIVTAATAAAHAASLQGLPNANLASLMLGNDVPATGGFLTQNTGIAGIHPLVQSTFGSGVLPPATNRTVNQILLSNPQLAASLFQGDADRNVLPALSLSGTEMARLRGAELEQLSQSSRFGGIIGDRRMAAATLLTGNMQLQHLQQQQLQLQLQQQGRVNVRHEDEERKRNADDIIEEGATNKKPRRK